MSKPTYEELETLLAAAEAKQEIPTYNRAFDRLWERFDEASHGNADQMKNILGDALNALEAAENRVDVLAQSHAQVIHTRDHYKALWRETKVSDIPGEFTLDELKQLYRDLIEAHVSKAMSGERMKTTDRNEDLAWCRQRIVSAKWFIEAFIEAHQGQQPLNLICSETKGTNL